MDDELAIVVGRGGTQALDVRAVAVLGHRETAEQLEILDRSQVSRVMPFGPEQLHGAAEQSPLDTGLDHQRQVAEAEHLERRHVAADVAPAAVLRIEAEAGPVRRGEGPQLIKHLRAMRLEVETDRVAERRRGHPVAHAAPHRGPTSVEHTGQRFGIHFGWNGWDVHGSSTGRRL